MSRGCCLISCGGISRQTGKSPAAVTRHRGFPQKGLERREVEKRIYGVRKEAVHGFRNLSVIRILFGFEHSITES